MPNSAKPDGPEIDPKTVRDLARILRDSDLSEIEVERGDLRIRVARQAGGGPVIQAAAPTYVAAPSAPAPAPAAAAAPATASPAVRDLKSLPGVVTSPMVGTAYLQPEPGASSFVKVGDTVTEGQTLMIVEAMKTMNPIPSPRAGTVREILIGDAQPIEFGEPLMIVE
jgi:acetyl-CoA carboxylase biotin carboxyl carrier protein